MIDAFYHSLGQQLRQPSGLAGQITGCLMRLLNARPNQMAIAVLDVLPEDTVLELGCGPGHALGILAKKTNGHISGIDMSPVMVEQSRSRNRNHVASGQMTVVKGDFRSLPFLDASVDKILAVNVAYFWTDACAILGEILRVLRPGGRISIYATNAATMRKWRFASNDTHIHYTRDNLLTLLEKNGFRACQVKETTICPIPRIVGLIATGVK